MKSHQYLILGIASTLFVVMLFYTAYPKIFIRDDNLNADDVFNEYIRNKLEESQTITSQASKVDDYVQNLNIVKNIVDGMELKSDTIGKRQSDTSNALPKIASDINSKVSQIFSLLSDSSAFPEITRAGAKIRNSILNEFRIYQDIYYSINYSFPSRYISPLFKDVLSKQTFNAHRQNVSTIISQQISSLIAVNNNYKKRSVDLDSAINKVHKIEKQTTENSRDKLLITMVIPIFACMLAIIIFIPYFLRSNNDLVNKILDDKILIQVFTIFILVISILLLGIGNKLSGETLGTLLGGISVYVLQKSLEKPNRDLP